jgi:RNA polymerase sigma-70 factor (ECF subfamily)
MTRLTQEIWEDFGQRLRSFILKRIDDPRDADDILQEVFIKIHTNLDSLQDDRRLVPWLYQITRNTIIDHYRSRKVGVPLPETLAIDVELAEKDPITQLAAGLRDMLACLPDKYRQALLLTELEGMKQQELAEQLGISLSGAKSRVQRGRVLLRDALFDCCHFEFDRLGQIMNYTPRPDCCRNCNN